MMTPEELKTEVTYRIAERIGICCGVLEPTPDVIALAEREAREWEAQQPI